MLMGATKRTSQIVASERDLGDATIFHGDAVGSALVIFENFVPTTVAIPSVAVCGVVQGSQSDRLLVSGARRNRNTCGTRNEMEAKSILTCADKGFTFQGSKNGISFQSQTGSTHRLLPLAFRKKYTLCSKKEKSFEHDSTGCVRASSQTFVVTSTSYLVR